MNYDFTLVSIFSKFLNSDFEKTITKDITSLLETGVTPCLALQIFIGESAGLDTFGKDRKFFSENFPKTIKELDANDYFLNDYYKTVKFKPQKVGDVELCHEKYSKYEPFVFDDLTCDFSGLVIPKIGFFSQEFTFPAIKEKGVIWMTVTPNEINTMKKPIQKARGKVLTLGLGLGYFAYCASKKTEVEKVVVVEKNEKIIEIFKSFILPFFPHPEKIEIIKSDAFDFLETPTENDFDLVFCDLWHDVSDGLTLSKKIKPYEKNFPCAEFLYWIEQSIKFYE